jgi:Fe-S-cluster containining protein
VEFGKLHAVRDGPVRRFLKWVARTVAGFDLAVTRAIDARRSPPRYRLEGSCNGCGRCCEAPAIAVGRLTWHVRSLRSAFLLWQRVVNGFELTGQDARLRTFVFRCTHYDATTKRCDAYESRPLMCRDYPARHASEAVPELFPECSYRVVDRKAAQLTEALRAAGLSGEKLDAVKKKLYLDGGE